jgi:hypothetical protein
MKGLRTAICVVALGAAKWAEAARAGLRTLPSAQDETVAIALVDENVTAGATSSPKGASAQSSNVTAKAASSSALVPTDAVNLCESRTGCSCSGATYIRQSPRRCVLMHFETKIKKNWDPFNKPTCSYTRTETAYDCSVCQSQIKHTDDAMGRRGTNVVLKEGMTLVASARAKVDLGQTATAQRDWCVDISDFEQGNTFFGYNIVTGTSDTSAGTLCNHDVVFKSCRAPTGAPTARGSEINTYAGWWDLATTSGSQEITVETVYSTTSTQEQTDKFTRGWELGGKVGFTVGLPLFGETTVEVTGKYSSTMEFTAKNTLAVQSQQTSRMTCAHTCTQAYVYVWKIQGYDKLNARYKVDVPSCLFQCIEPALQGHIPPQCPPTYCGHTAGRNSTNPGTCLCCTSLEWADSKLTNLPPLCPGW